MANLHLVVNEEIKQKAKVIAKQQGKNLSTLVEAYLFSLVRQERGIELSAELLEVVPLTAAPHDDKARQTYLDQKYGVRGSSTARLSKDDSAELSVDSQKDSQDR